PKDEAEGAALSDEPREQESPQPAGPPIEASPPQRRPTLLELFRSARSGESDVDAPPAFARDAAPAPAALPPAPPPSIFKEPVVEEPSAPAFAESIFTEHAAAAHVDETPSPFVVAEPTEASVEPSPVDEVPSVPVATEAAMFD